MFKTINMELKIDVFSHSETGRKLDDIQRDIEFRDVLFSYQQGLVNRSYFSIAIEIRRRRKLWSDLEGGRPLLITRRKVGHLPRESAPPRRLPPRPCWNIWA
jgi:hypothetical protein